MLDKSTALATAGEKFYPLLRAHGIEPFEYMGRPAFVPRQVATALGYASPKVMLGWLTKFEGVATGTHYGVLSGGDLATVKGLDVPGLVGGRTSWRETILFMPGLLVVLMESNKARGSATLGRQFRWWLCRDYLPAWRKENGQTPEEMLEMIASGNYPKRPAVREVAAPIETDEDRWALVLTTENARERDMLWRTATELRKAEIKAADAAYVVEQERRRTELLTHRRLTVEMNQKERGRLVGKLVAAMRDEIEDHREHRRKVRRVADLAGKTWAVIADDRYGQGTEPVLLRDTLRDD